VTKEWWMSSAGVDLRRPQWAGHLSVTQNDEARGDHEQVR